MPRPTGADSAFAKENFYKQFNVKAQYWLNRPWVLTTSERIAIYWGEVA